MRSTCCSLGSTKSTGSTVGRSPERLCVPGSRSTVRSARAAVHQPAGDVAAMPRREFPTEQDNCLVVPGGFVIPHAWLCRAAAARGPYTRFPLNYPFWFIEGEPTTRIEKALAAAESPEETIEIARNVFPPFSAHPSGSLGSAIDFFLRRAREVAEAAAVPTRLSTGLESRRRSRLRLQVLAVTPGRARAAAGRRRRDDLRRRSESALTRTRHEGCPFTRVSTITEAQRRLMDRGAVIGPIAPGNASRSASIIQQGGPATIAARAATATTRTSIPTARRSSRRAQAPIQSRVVVSHVRGRRRAAASRTWCSGKAPTSSSRARREIPTSPRPVRQQGESSRVEPRAGRLLGRARGSLLVQSLSRRQSGGRERHRLEGVPLAAGQHSVVSFDWTPVSSTPATNAWSRRSTIR